MEYYKLNIEETLEKVNSSLDGLTEKQAQERLLKNGENKLEEQEKKSIFSLILTQLKDVMIYVLIGAAIITVVVNKEFTDAIIILAVVFINHF